MSKIFTLNVQDAIKGVIVAVLSAVIALILSMLQNGVAIDWKSVGVTALIAGLGYITKNFLSDDQGKLGGKI